MTTDGTSRKVSKRKEHALLTVRLINIYIYTLISTPSGPSLAYSSECRSFYCQGASNSQESILIRWCCKITDGMAKELKGWCPEVWEECTGRPTVPILQAQCYLAALLERGKRCGLVSSSKVLQIFVLKWLHRKSKKIEQCLDTTCSGCYFHLIQHVFIKHLCK